MKLKKIKFTNDEIFFIFNQILNALLYLHTEVKLIHKDLNPNNILIDVKKLTKVTDFGISTY